MPLESTWSRDMAARVHVNYGTTGVLLEPTWSCGLVWQAVMAMEWRLDAMVDYLFGMKGRGWISARCHGGWHEMHGGDARV